MNAKWKKVLSIAQVALQIPMLALWWIVYNTVMMTCHALQRLENGGLTLTFDPSKILCALLVYAPLILPLVACMVLSIWGLVWVLKGNCATGLAPVFLYGGLVLACSVLIFGFSRPSAVYAYGQIIHNLFGNETTYCGDLLLSEFMFYRYPLGLDIRYDLIDIFPLMRSIKYILLGLQMAVCGTLCATGILKLKKI